MANAKITELNLLESGDIAASDVLAIVDVGASETKKIDAIVLAAYAVTRSGIIQSGAIASGQLGGNHFASGAKIDVSEWVTDNTYTTSEIVSGGSVPAAVCLSIISGAATVRAAMASVSGRMPAIGVVFENLASGATANVFAFGKVFSTLMNFSGWMNRPIYVGRSGQISASGAPTLSGDIQQIIGQVIQHSGMFVNPQTALEEIILQSGDVGSGAIMGNGFGGSTIRSIVSGSIDTLDFASGASIPYGRMVMTTAELISGLKAVTIASGDGSTIVRAERQSGLRLPAIGVTSVGGVSGARVVVVWHGPISHASSGMIASGFHGENLFVGSGGLIINQSGFHGGASSGAPFLSGSLCQRLGYAISGGIFVQVDRTPTSGLYSGLLGQY